MRRSGRGSTGSDTRALSIDALGDEAAEPREATSMPVISTDAEIVGLAKRQREAADQADLDHDVAEPEAGEIDDGAELAGRSAEGGAPAEDAGQQDQRESRDDSHAERCPQHEIAPVVLEQVEPVERPRQVGKLFVAGEIGPGRWSAAARRRRIGGRSPASRRERDSARRAGPSWSPASAPRHRRPLPTNRNRSGGAAVRRRVRWQPRRASPKIGGAVVRQDLGGLLRCRRRSPANRSRRRTSPGYSRAAWRSRRAEAAPACRGRWWSTGSSTRRTAICAAVPGRTPSRLLRWSHRA